MAIYRNKKTKKWYFRTYVYDPVKEERVQVARYGFELRREAVEAEAILISEYENKKYTYSGITFDFVLSEFIDDYKKRVKVTTYKATKGLINNHISDVFKGVKFERINRPMLQNWREQINNRKISTNHKNRILKLLTSIFDFANRHYNLKNRHIYNLAPFKVSSNETIKKRSIYTEEQFNQFIANANDFQIAFFTTLFYSGMRIGEIRALKWTDFDNKQQSINVTKQINSKMGIGNIEMLPKSESSIRKIWLPDKANQVLIKWKEDRKKVFGFEESWYIFGDLSVIGETTITRYKNKLADKAALHRITLHEFRHSYATMLYKSDIAPEIAKELLGHKSIATTIDTYTHISDNLISDEVKKKLNK